MNCLYSFLFPDRPMGKRFSLFILAFRLLFGILLMMHGIQKWAQFEILSTTFPNPIGIGSHISLLLVILAELFCSMFFIVGFMYRIVLLPMIFSMCIAFFIVHSCSISNGGELSFIYLIVFSLLYIIGPGRYSLDKIISRNINHCTSM